MTVAGQPDVVYAYDDANRVTSITQAGTVVSFTADDAGRVLSANLPNGVTATYTYDDASHVTSVVFTKGGSTVGDLTYTYDAIGRRTTAGGTLARITLPAAVSTTTYNANNQLTKWVSNSIKPTYDANGNMLSDGSLTYIWNARDELIQIKTGNTVTAAFSYDAVGRRISKTAGGSTTGFSYDGGSFVQEKNGSTPTANLLIGGTDETYSRTDSGGARTFLSDALGSTVALTDAAGTIQTSYTYEPFGKTTVTGAASSNAQQFNGRENDGPAYFYRARYYNPTFGRFISEDPLGFTGSGANLYAYVGNDPINQADPSGEIAPLVVACGVGAIFSIGFDLIANALGHRKTSFGDLLGSAASGCAFGAAGFGIGKVFANFVAAGGAATVGAASSGLAATAQVTLNRAAGKAAEAWLATAFGGKSVTITTTIGRRVIDNLTGGLIAQEAKVGAASLTKFIANQIQKDIELLQKGFKIEWHFFPNAAGEVGPSGPLLDALQQAGFKIIIH